MQMFQLLISILISHLFAESYTSLHYRALPLPDVPSSEGAQPAASRVMYRGQWKYIDKPTPLISQIHTVPRCAPLADWEDEQLLQTA